MKRIQSPFKREDLFRKWEKVPRQDRSNAEKFTAHDLLAMILAVLSIVLPWVLAVVGSLGLILFLFWAFYLKH